MSATTIARIALIDLPRNGRGTFVIERGPTLIARWFARIAGFATDGLLNVSMSVRSNDDSQAMWHRRFGSIRRTSIVRVNNRCGATTPASLVESFGPVHVTFSVNNFSVEHTSAAFDRAIELRSAHACVGTHRHAITIPLRWTPTVVCRLTDQADRQLVDVTVTAPTSTLIVRYHGAIQ
jgi:hypothetical protein